jgi:DNA processing protein
MISPSWFAALGALPGSKALRDQLREAGSADRLLAMGRAAMRSAGIGDDEVATLHSPDQARIARWQKWLAGAGNRDLLTLDDPRYPRRLAELPDPPLALWVQGDNAERLRDPQIAIVGSRQPTPGGREIAVDFATRISNAGITVTSGLATGIDSAAHLGALQGSGGTIAVLGSGLMRLFPRANTALANDVQAAGLVVSEYAPDVPPRPFHFPQRNRIIAGLSLATVVVEAGRRSGALITARCALDAGREVFAVPGSIHNPMARGCHALIRQGAILVEHAADVLAELADQLRLDIIAPAEGSHERDNGPAQASLFDDSSYLELLNSLDFSPATVSDLARRSGLTAAELSSMLLLLEMEGYVEALPGGRYARTAKRSR